MSSNDGRIIQLPTLALRMEFSAAWKAVREWLVKTPLHSITWAINRASVAWEDGDRGPVLIGPRDSSFHDMEARNPAYRWAASELIRHAVLWSPVYTHGGPLAMNETLRDEVWFHVHISAAAQLEAMPSDVDILKQHGVEDFLHSTFGPQYLFQRSIPWLRVGQALLMFRDAPHRRKRRDPRFPLEAFEDLVKNALGTDIGRFVAFVVLLYDHSLQPDPILGALTWSTQEREIAEKLGLVSRHGHIEISHVPAMLQRMSASPKRMRAWMEEQIDHPGASEAELICAPNPLLRYPILQPFFGNNDLSAAPIPSQLLEWLNEPLVHELHEAIRAPSQFTRAHFSQIFEEYVGLLLDACSPDGQRWWNEDEFARLVDAQKNKGTRLVDWGRVFTDSMVFVDAKRGFLSPASRYRLDDRDWDSLKKKSLIEGTEQLGSFARVYAERNPSLVAHRESIGVIVTQSDSAIIAHWNELRQQLLETSQEYGITLVLLSLDQFQNLMTNWLEKGEVEWLPNSLRELAAKGRGAIHKIAPPRQSGPLWDAVSNLVSYFSPEGPRSA